MEGAVAVHDWFVFAFVAAHGVCCPIIYVVRGDVWPMLLCQTHAYCGPDPPSARRDKGGDIWGHLWAGLSWQIMDGLWLLLGVSC